MSPVRHSSMECRHKTCYTLMMRISRMLGSPRIRRPGKESFWIAAGNAAAVLGGLAGIRILTELMTPAEYGELALGVTIAVFANQIFSGPLSGGATRFYSLAVERGELRYYLRAVYEMSLVGNVVILLLATCIAAAAVLMGVSGWGR